MNKNIKKQKVGNDFRRLQRAVFIKMAGILVTVIGILLIVYSVFLRGRIANTVVWLFEHYIYGDYGLALDAYWQIVRNHKNFYIIIVLLACFMLAFRICIKSFANYFNEMNQGFDALLEEDSEDIVLSSVLETTEIKINDIKHTLRNRKLAAELAEQRKNDLVVYLAHDLKTPLTSVIGYLTLLRDEKEISKELREKYLSISLEKAERLEDLINEFFEITRFNLSSVTLEYSRVNLTRMLEQLTCEFEPIFLEKNLKCVLDIKKDLFFKCDVDKLQRVFDNLLRNAVNYSYEDSAIFIVAQQNENNMVIRFLNQGNTIPKEKLERIFEQFYRLDTSRSSKSGGAGLGLAIAKEIIELHGGKITAESENETIKFEVILPVL